MCNSVFVYLPSFPPVCFLQFKCHSAPQTVLGVGIYGFDFPYYYKRKRILQRYENISLEFKVGSQRPVIHDCHPLRLAKERACNGNIMV